MKLDKKEIERVITTALKEDIGAGDITTNLLIAKNQKAKAFFLAKEDGIIAGLNIAKMVFQQLDQTTKWKSFIKDGELVTAGTRIAEVKGSLRALLTGERTALNILQRMSGIATATNNFVTVVKDTNAKILDTRKTVPGFRLLDKYAVKLGGGINHRIGLFDMVLIKDNHIKAAGSITNAVNKIKKGLTKKIKIEVETRNLEEVREALDCKVEIIMLDNMSVAEMKDAVMIIGGKAKIEASGNINLQSLRKIAETGVDFISVGALTHSVKALDISMKIM
ncbi:MAG: carboxylating nicotinate-nucleotide diphosphorylase [Ignavibacteriaceae bacterium]|jgi:nicotinate-nucleotide pyrophosphorylase (carboxylating)|nr:carboxylating nicotinate-nucleotide diphosphorylase [Ignavibacteriaceae bacterium]